MKQRRGWLPAIGVVIAAALLAPAGAAAAVSCTSTRGVLTVNVSGGGSQTAGIVREAGSTNILVKDGPIGSGTNANCGGQPSVTNTARIDVFDVGTNQRTFFTVSLSQGAFAPGVGSEGGGGQLDEIEIDVDLKEESNDSDRFTLEPASGNAIDVFDLGDVAGAVPAINANATLGGGDTDADITYLGSDSVEIFGLGGNDVIGSVSEPVGDFVGPLSSAANIFGDNGNDVITAGTGGNGLSGGLGNDSLSGGSGNDILQMNSGNDTAAGNGGTDTVDFLSSGSTGVTFDLRQTTQQDTGHGLKTVSGAENVRGNRGTDDTLTGNDQANVLTDDEVSSDTPGDDTLIGLGGGDTLTAGNGNDTMLGGDGLDTLRGGPGSDLVDGGTSTDTYSYAFQTGPATVTLGDDLCNDGTSSDTAAPGTTAPSGCSANGVDRDRILNVEGVSGTAAADDITGGPGAEALAGGGGSDDLEGGFGVDQLLGGADADVLTSRDGVVDAATQCGLDPNVQTPGDRAVADPDDPVDPSCTTIERGPFGTPGPVGTPPPTDPTAPPEFQPTPTPEITPGVPSNGTEGPGPGGGDGGLTPPEIEITSPNATVRKGIAELRVRCVYLAQACVGEIELTAKKDAAKGRGRDKVEIEKGDVLGDQVVSIPWGTSEPTLVKVSKDVKKLFKAGAEKLKAVAVLTARDSAAPAGAAEAEITAPVNLGAAGR